MDLKLKNIGVVYNSNIKINGITVITGKNNTGKTTISKSLYAIISAVENLENNALKEKQNFAFNVFNSVLTECGLSRIYSFYDLDEDLNNESAINIVFNNKTIRFASLSDLIDFVDKVCVELELLSKEDILPRIKEKDLLIRSNRFDTQWENFQSLKYNGIKKLQQLKDTLMDDPKLIHYSNMKILKALNQEFFSQIAPVKNIEKVTESQISLKNDKINYYDIIISNKEVINKETFFINAFSKCWLIDDVSVVDELNRYERFKKLSAVNNFYYGKKIYEVSPKEFKESLTVKGHREYLLEGLTKNIGEYELSVYKNRAARIFEIINCVFDDEIKYIDGKYICETDKLDVRNLASGSKLFLIIKVLLENGCLDDKSLLLLDEPENHLHPDWINKLAEVIVLIQKMLSVKIVITTHSPNFLLALETFSKKHKTYDTFFSYVAAKKEDDYLVDFENISDNIEKAFSHLAQPYLEMDALRYSILEDKN